MIPDNQKESFVNELFPYSSMVLLVKGDDADVGGNAVIIAPNIAITAAHVIKNNKFKSFQSLNFAEEKGQYFPEESLNILMYSVKYKTNYMLNVKQVVFIKDSDLAVLYLVDHSGKLPGDAWNSIILNLASPDIEHHVFTTGSRVKKSGYSIDNGTINVQPEYTASLGVVTQFRAHPYNGPGLYTTLTTFNTLSGSPVYNSDKELVGLISGGFEGDPLSFISILYPLFTSRFKLNDVDAFHLYDLAKKGVINCKGLDRVEILNNNEARITLPRSLEEKG